MKRNHIQKCLQWCEKNQIPCNKFIDNTNTNNNNNITNIHNNIFLNMKNRVTQHGNDIQNVDVELEEAEAEAEAGAGAGAEAARAVVRVRIRRVAVAAAAPRDR